MLSKSHPNQTLSFKKSKKRSWRYPKEQEQTEQKLKCRTVSDSLKPDDVQRMKVGELDDVLQAFKQVIAESLAWRAKWDDSAAVLSDVRENVVKEALLEALSQQKSKWGEHIQSIYEFLQTKTRRAKSESRRSKNLLESTSLMSDDVQQNKEVKSEMAGDTESDSDSNAVFRRDNNVRLPRIDEYYGWRCDRRRPLKVS